MGTGTIEEAQRWVEYLQCERTVPYYAELRKKHGYPEPWGIKYWSRETRWTVLANGTPECEDYCKKARKRLNDATHRPEY
jgi:alpha-N-arabinofuranosidase